MKNAKYGLFAFVMLIACFLMLRTPAAATENDSTPVGDVESVLYAMNYPGATVVETTLGNATADIVRSQCGTDIAILCGGEFRANLQGGPVTKTDIAAVFDPDSYLAVAHISAADLRNILEVGVAHSCLKEDETMDYDASAFDGFPQISGFSFTYDVTNPVGERITQIVLEDGTELDLSDITLSLSLAATLDMLSGGHGMPIISNRTTTDLTISDVMILYLMEQQVITVPELGRITVKGALVRIADNIPLSLVLIAIAFLAVGSSRGIWKKGKFTRF